MVEIGGFSLLDARNLFFYTCNPVTRLATNIMTNATAKAKPKLMLKFHTYVTLTTKPIMLPTNIECKANLCMLLLKQ